MDAAVLRADEMIRQGATIIDVGGESTRPGSDPVSEREELNRVIPVLEACIPRWPEIRFSIDTTKFAVAEQSLKIGAHYINDVSGLRKEPRFIDLCAAYQSGLIIMHSIGDPKNMQESPVYRDVTAEVLHDLATKASSAREKGVTEIVIDPGIGFGKTLDHNLQLLRDIALFVETGYPVMIGASRKSMFGQLLDGRSADGRLAATLVTHYHALTLGAAILRVHDVQEAHDSLVMFKHLST